MFEEWHNSILENLSEIKRKEYEIANYEIPENLIYKPAIEKEKKDDQDTKHIKQQMQQFSYQAKKKASIKGIKQEDEADVLESTDVFNTIDNDVEYLTWRKVKKEDKLIKIDDYFDTHIFPKINKENEYAVTQTNKLKEQIVDLINTGKLNTMKDVQYDKVNQRIENIVHIYFDVEEEIWKMSVPEVSHKKEMMKKVSKLFKK